MARRTESSTNRKFPIACSSPSQQKVRYIHASHQQHNAYRAKEYPQRQLQFLTRYLIEQWDDALPTLIQYPGGARRGSEYTQIAFPMYDDDSETKMNELADVLAQSDVVVLANAVVGFFDDDSDALAAAGVELDECEDCFALASADEDAQSVLRRAGVAVRVTDAPVGKEWVQALPQLMPVGELVTVPLPVPSFTTVSALRSTLPPGQKVTL